VFLAREGFYDGLVFHRVIASFSRNDATKIKANAGDSWRRVSPFQGLKSWCL
jgi:cyclophilin family peptidyl-prolyl cis-trans isomerase